MMTQLLRVEEVAARLGLRPVTVWRMVRCGELASVRPTGRRAVRVREADLEALIRRGAQRCQVRLKATAR